MAFLFFTGRVDQLWTLIQTKTLPSFSLVNYDVLLFNLILTHGDLPAMHTTCSINFPKESPSSLTQSHRTSSSSLRSCSGEKLMSDLIPDHILIDILQKLPVKSLLKCRCVSKSWNSLITSPFFITTHSTEAAKSYPLVKCYSRIKNKGWYALFQPHNTLSPAKTLNFPVTSRSSNIPFEVAGSVNGLLCILDALDCNLIILWNPTINRHIKLPKPSITSSVAFSGLGFDHSVNDFKVVRLAYAGLNLDWTYRARVEIWSLRNPVWRLLPDHDDTECCHMAKHGSPAFFMAGSVHWLANLHPRSRGVSEQKHSNAVLLFDVEKERFRTLGLPSELRCIDIGSIWLSKFGASLALLYFDNRLHPSRCEIWVMTEYGVEETWVKMISTELQLGVENKSWVREHWTNMILATIESELSMKLCDDDEEEDEYGKVFGLCYGKGESVVCADKFTESLVLLDVDIHNNSSSDCTIMY